jgi:enoyl-CoA hydratase/carnithine racemase
MKAPQLKRAEISCVGTAATLTLASDKVNALDLELLQEITAFVEYCEQEPEVGALVVTGQGSVFSAGLNVNELLGNEKSFADVLLNELTVALGRLFQCPKPTVAAINGPAIAGGCLLALACDKRLIAEEARMGVTELRVGVAFPIVAIELLKHACGAHAEQLIFDAKLLDADDACRCGLAHQRFPRSELQSAALSDAETLGSLDARAYALAKASTRRSTLAAMEHEGGQLLDRQVRDHWKDDVTRVNLERLLKPKA